MILEEAPALAASPAAKGSQLILLSARSETALDAGSKRLSSWLESNPTANLADAAYSLAMGRKALPLRHFAVVDENSEVAAALETHSQPQPIVDDAKPDVVFMFPGQGAQYPQMGRQLYQQEPVFAKEIDRCAEQLWQHADFDLLDLLYSDSIGEEQAAERLKKTANTQPALFAVELALARLWQSWGVEPTALVGHSVGEYVAACLADVFSVEDALRLVALRGKLIQELPAGQMLAVTLPAEQVRNRLPEDLAIAAVNSPETCVLAGTAECVSQFAAELESTGVSCTTLRTSHAFHSPMMEPMIERFRAELETVNMQPAKRKIYSTVTGELAAPEHFASPDHWVANVRSAVRFSDCAASMLEHHRGVFVEVGPGQTLGSLLRQHPVESSPTVLSSLPNSRDATPARKHLLKSLGKAWQAGVLPSWSSFYESAPRNRVPLPSYAFDRQSHWLTPDTMASSPSTPTATPAINSGVVSSPSNPAAMNHGSASNWLWQPSWVPAPISDAGSLPAGPWLLFSDRNGVAARLRDQLADSGQEVVEVHLADKFSQVDEQSYTLSPDNAQHYDELFQNLVSAGDLPSNIVHCFGLASDKSQSEGEWDEQSVGLHSLISLAQAIGRHCPTRSINLCVATAGMHSVSDGEPSHPAMATVLGPGKMIPIEYPKVRCRSIDFALADDVGADTLAARLANEFRDQPSDLNNNDTIVAYRNGVRLRESIEPILASGSTVPITDRIRDGATYLILGGLGGLGSALANEIARHVRANFALVGRSKLPSRKVQSIQDIESAGSKCLYLQADATDKGQMEAALAEVKNQFGKIDGVIHAAGMMDTAGPMQSRSAADTDRVLGTKVRGVEILDELLADQPLDWMILCSSNTTSLYHHRLGEVAYVAANCFLDAYAPAARQRFPDRLTQTINWDAWQGVGMTAAALQRTAAAFVKDTVFNENDAMTADEGTRVFGLALKSDAARVIVSKRDLRVRLQDALPQPTRPTNGRVSSVNGDTAGHLAEIWQDLLGVQRVSADDDFFALGGTSLTAIQMNSRIGATLGKQLPLATILQARTIKTLTKLIDGDAPQRKSVALVDLKPHGDRPPLFLMHAAGGNVMFYRQLCDRLAKDQPVYALQSQGLTESLPLATTIAEMAELYTRELRQVAPQGPYLLGGYCMGGTIAFEVAQQLRAQGEEVALVAMLETYDWAKIKPIGLVAKSRFWLEKMYYFWSNSWILPSPERRIFWREKMNVIRDRWAVWRGRWSQRATEARDDRLLSELWRVNDLAASRYRPRPYDSAIVHFRPSKTHAMYRDCEFVADDVRFCQLDCHPAAMMLEPFVGQLAVRLTAEIDRALAQNGQLVPTGITPTH